MSSIVRVEGICKYYTGVNALNDVSFEIKQGEVHALVGENGAGKSTLIKILSGVIQPNNGTIFVDNQPCVFKHPLEAMRKGVAVTYQDLSLFWNLTVAENIAISSVVEEGKQIIDWKGMRKQAKQALDQLDIDIDLDVKLQYLSIGNQNLVAIARAIVHSAKVLILDEPTASLSNEEVKSLFRIIRMLRDRGMGILFVSHRLQEVFEISDRTTVFRDGCYIDSYETEQLKEEDLIAAMVGRKIHFLQYDFRQGEEEILHVEKLTKENNYKDISFTLKRGEIVGFTGLVGAGRTEIALSLFGATSPDSGDIILNGKKITMKRTEDAVKNGIAYIPESRHTHGLVTGKTLTQNITISILESLTNRLNIINRKKERKIAKKWIEKLNIKPAYPTMMIDKFSGGNQQKAVIAKWLAYEPKLLIVDEPTHGIDIGAKTEIHKLLRDLAKGGMGIIVISSDLPEVLAVADRILVMRRGRLVGEFTSTDADQEKIMNIALKGKC